MRIRLFYSDHFTVHPHVHRIKICSGNPAHFGSRSLPPREILRHDPGHFLPGLGHAFRNDAMIRAHDCKCGLIKRDPGRTPPDPGDPCNIILQDPETADRLCNGIPSFFRKFHCMAIRRDDPVQAALKFFFDCLCCHRVVTHYLSLCHSLWSFSPALCLLYKMLRNLRITVKIQMWKTGIEAFGCVSALPAAGPDRFLRLKISSIFR